MTGVQTCARPISLHMVYEKEEADALEAKLLEAYGEGSRVPVMELRRHPDPQIQAIAQYVYEKIFLRYTMKQWGQTPEEISPEVTGRVPVLISYDNRYFQDKYQGVPKDGFFKLFERMLDHENITVQTGTDARELLKIQKDGLVWDGQRFMGSVIYTGELDELYDCRYGRLEIGRAHV